MVTERNTEQFTDKGRELKAAEQASPLLTEGLVGNELGVAGGRGVTAAEGERDAADRGTTEEGVERSTTTRPSMITFEGRTPIKKGFRSHNTKSPSNPTNKKEEEKEEKKRERKERRKNEEEKKKKTNNTREGKKKKRGKEGRQDRTFDVSQPVVESQRTSRISGNGRESHLTTHAQTEKEQEGTQTKTIRRKNRQGTQNNSLSLFLLFFFSFLLFFLLLLSSSSLLLFFFFSFLLTNGSNPYCTAFAAS
jgi:hypothetical protein